MPMNFFSLALSAIAFSALLHESSETLSLSVLMGTVQFLQAAPTRAPIPTAQICLHGTPLSPWLWGEPGQRKIKSVSPNSALNQSSPYLSRKVSLLKYPADLTASSSVTTMIQNPHPERGLIWFTSVGWRTKWSDKCQAFLVMLQDRHS